MYDALTFKFSLKVARKIIVTTQQEQNEVIKFGVPIDNTVIIPHGILSEQQYLKRGHIRKRDSSHRYKLLIVGRITSIRNFEFLIKMFKKLSEIIPEAELYCVGSNRPHSQVFYNINYVKKILDLCHQLGVSEKVYFLGELRGEELEKLYQMADVFVWTSKYENFGQALVDAASFGLPIVSTKVGVAPFLIGDNEGGFLVDHDDIEGMAKMVAKLLKNDFLYEKACKAVQNKAKNFTVERMALSYENLYLEILRQQES
jgi:glycosyltransferase involved in cell wall biosynthesis